MRVTNEMSNMCQKFSVKIVSKLCHNFDCCQKSVKPEVCYLLFIGCFCLFILLIALRCWTDK